MRLLFESTRTADFAALPLPDAQRAALIDMQFRAQRGQYAAAYPEASFDILERNGSPIGSLTVDRSAGAIRLVEIALLAEHRGEGLGTEILLGLLDEAAASGKVVSLQVALSNPAQRLYRRLGFQETGRDGVYMQMQSTIPSPD